MFRRNEKKFYRKGRKGREGKSSVAADFADGREIKPELKELVFCM